MANAKTSAPDSQILSSAQRRPPSRWGLAALVLGLLALVGGALCTGYVGVTIVPEQLEVGGMLLDTRPDYRSSLRALMPVILLLSVCLLGAIAAGIVALVHRERPGMPVGGIAAAVLAPALWFTAFAVPATIAAWSL